MRFGKVVMFFLLQGLAVVALLCYFGLWMINGKTTATIVRPYYSNTINVNYQVKEQFYTGSYSRYDVPFSARTVTIRYLLFRPASSKINSFMGIAAEPLAWWLVFLLASAMLLLMPNTVFSKGTIFQVHKSFPWISMEEYFPENASWWWYEKTGPTYQSSKSEQKFLQNNSNA